ncbi:divalent-cation tolerance protein CutA [Coraliomargarita parva]|uniref:divalent-cation tolerance protein CutA n=1 Tax=Coraliomargarita parva TaxID=3014050 RepID=UPI0022B3E1AC|nr:divalent-cation tolerance protein CutA [Coraliomargarita parva]
MSVELLIGWTTCDNEDIAERMAQELVERDLVACVQLDPIRSIFKWKGEMDSHQELRLTLKFAPGKLKSIEAFLNANHPYENPEWVVVQAESASQKYLNWVQS